MQIETAGESRGSEQEGWPGKTLTQKEWGRDKMGRKAGRKRRGGSFWCFFSAPVPKPLPRGKVSFNTGAGLPVNCKEEGKPGSSPARALVTCSVRS